MRNKILLCAILAVALLAAAASQVFHDSDSGASGGTQFKEDYEALNGTATQDGGNTHIPLDIPADMPFRYAGFDEIKAILEGGTGVVYFGFPSCPWCRTLLDVFPGVLAETENTPHIYCFDLREYRDERSLGDDGSIVVEKEASEEYLYLLGRLGNWLGVYEGLNSDGIKRIYMPTLIFVSEGKIKDVHIGTVESQTDGYDPLSPAGRLELQNALRVRLLQIAES